MARTSPVEAVLTAMVTRLKADATVVSLATGGIYNHVPQQTGYPYVVVSAPTDHRVDTFGKFGANTLLDVKAVSQGRGDQEGARILDAVLQSLDAAKPSLSQHVALGTAWEGNERYQDVVNGIVTRYHVASFRIWTEQV